MPVADRDLAAPVGVEAVGGNRELEQLGRAGAAAVGRDGRAPRSTASRRVRLRTLAFIRPSAACASVVPISPSSTAHVLASARSRA